MSEPYATSSRGTSFPREKWHNQMMWREQLPHDLPTGKIWYTTPLALAQPPRIVNEEEE